MLVAPFFFFWLGRYRGHGPLLLINRALAVGAGHARDGGWARLLVVGSTSGRWSVRGGVPTLERGNDQHEQKISMVGTTPPLGRARGGGGRGCGGSPAADSKARMRAAWWPVMRPKYSLLGTPCRTH